MTWGSSYSHRHDEPTERERYLESELERERQSAREAEEQRQQERERSRRERRAEYEQEQRSASSWPEALQKQAWLCQREVNNFPEEEVGDSFFSNQVEANEAALKIWREVATRRQAEIDAIWESIRREVADKLEAASTKDEYRMVANLIREDELEGYLDW